MCVCVLLEVKTGVSCNNIPRVYGNDSVQSEYQLWSVKVNRIQTTIDTLTNALHFSVVRGLCVC